MKMSFKINPRVVRHHLGISSYGMTIQCFFASNKGGFLSLPTAKIAVEFPKFHLEFPKCLITYL